MSDQASSPTNDALSSLEPTTPSQSSVPGHRHHRSSSGSNFNPVTSFAGRDLPAFKDESDLRGNDMPGKEDDREELCGDNLENDHCAIPEIDTCAADNLDDSEYSVLIEGDRHAAEVSMMRRDCEEGRTGRMRRGLLYDDNDQDEDDRPARKRRMAERAVEGDVQEDEEMIESVENVEDMKGHSVHEWVSMLGPRTEIYNHIKNFLRTYVNDKGSNLNKDKIRQMCEAINWMKQRGLLRIEMKCGECKTAMNWTACSSVQDKFVWKCQQKVCAKYKQTTSIRKDSFFFRSKLSLQKWIEAIFYWCEDISVTQAVNFLNLSRVTVIEVFSLFREICTNYFKKNPIKLGGAGMIVQTDESCFSHKPKYHKGRAPNEPIWVFGLVDTSTVPCVGYMEIVESRSAMTLFPIINKVVRPGTVVHSDQWKAYSNIQRDLGLEHHAANHSVSFVDSHMDVHTQSVESYWGRHKSRIKSMQGCKREFLHSYLQEFMWRERNKQDTFHALCRAIADQYN